MTAVYSHRGARSDAPENTLDGFRYAVGLGVAGVELDVRLSADDVLIVIHDETVDRTTDGTGRVADLTVDQLRRLDARRTCPTWPDPAGVPTFADVVAALAGARPVALQVEVKRDAPERLQRACASLARVLRDPAMDGRTMVSSFEPAALEIMRSVAPHLHRALITSKDPAASIATATRLGCSQIDIERSLLSRDAVDEAHRRGLRVTGWFGNTAEELRHLMDCGVDKILSDVPDLALHYVEEGSETRPRSLG